MIDKDELAAWLRLLETPELGPQEARRLLAAFGSPQAVWEAGPTAWRALVPPEVAGALAAEPQGWAEHVETAWQWLGADPRRAVVTLGDAHYPQRLLDIPDPPLLLYTLGRRELLNAPSLAIVGSRNPTPQGAENARCFARHLSQAGLTVVSGLALGIDGAAHEGALEGPGRTVAVVGTGLDRVYPKRHLALAHRLADEGLIVSEYPLGTPPLKPNFPRRNRIISGMTRGTLVVEAAVHSGSLITARLAAEQGREVFAIPGSIHSPQSRGCHLLIKQGAKLVESAQDILEELRLDAPGPAACTDPADRGPTARDPVLEALGHDPASLDALVARTGWPAPELSARLLELELEGHVARLPGQLFQRIERA